MSIYQRLLPRLPFPSLRVLGALSEDDEGNMWFFLEDGGEECYRSASADHREALARWLSALHSQNGLLDSNPNLPPRGSPFYHTYLDQSQSLLRVSRTNPVLNPENHRILDEIQRVTDRLKDRWNALDQFCEQMPVTVVHGDLVEKNIRVSSGVGDTLSVLVFDWETAGRGCPAPDLASSGIGQDEASLRLYVSLARAELPNLTIEDARRMAQVGLVFRMVAGIRWACEGLQDSWVAASLNDLRYYAKEFTELDLSGF